MRTYCASDVITAGIGLECNAGRFYADAARNVKDQSTAALLEQLAATEASHERILQAMKKQLDDSERVSSFDRPAEAQVPLQAMAGGAFLDYHIDPNHQLTGKETAEEIIETAIAMEKNAVVYYEALLAMVPPELGQARVQTLIEEEQRHRRLLEERLAVLRVRRHARAAPA